MTDGLKAEVNMLDKSVTAETSQYPIGWLKAEAKMWHASVTLETSQ